LRDISLTKTKSQKARARANSRSNQVISGSGAYSMKQIKSAIAPMLTSLRPVVREALTGGGRALGAYSGLPGGGIFGEALGKKLSKLIGSGDYTSNTALNDLFTKKAALNAHMVFGDDPMAVRVRRREFLGDISSSSVAGAFVNYTYPINAGMRQTFPFLSQMAANYEEYCFNGLVFEFISSSSPYLSSSALGSVVAAMEYNANAPSFTTKYVMENSALAISNRIDKNLMYGVECAKSDNAQNCYYIRSGASTLPATTTDLGNFQIALAPGSSFPTSAIVGELWVTYDVWLKRPVLNPSRFGFYHQYATTGTASTPLGPTALVSAATNVGNSVVASVSPTVITLTNMVVGDYYLLWWYFAGANTAVLVYPTVTLSGLTAVNAFTNDTASSVTMPLAGVTSAVMSIGYYMTASATSGTITFGTGGTFPTTTTNQETFLIGMGNAIPATSF